MSQQQQSRPEQKEDHPYMYYVSKMTGWGGFGKWPLKLIYSEKATKFCVIVTLLLTTVHTVKSKVKILQNFVAFHLFWARQFLKEPYHLPTPVFLQVFFNIFCSFEE